MPEIPQWMAGRWIPVAAFAAMLSALPVLAHHPGANIDAYLGDREKYFQPIDRPMPAFELSDADGAPVSSADFAGNIVVLHFIYTGCPDVCPLHADKLARIQDMVAQSPMKDIVRFVSITTDPLNDTPAAMKSYGRDRGLDPASWRFLTTRPGQAEDATRILAQAFGHRFVKTGDGLQLHNVVTHVIDRNGRWAANFHGLRFEPVNMVLYLNGILNTPPPPPARPGWWGRLMEYF